MMFITCVHQGFELYGSDRSFAECVAVLRRTYPQAHIEVVLPRKGPITSLLDGVCSRIVYEPVWVLRRKNFLRLMTLGLLALPSALFRAIQRFRKADLVYINTSVIVDYTLVARLFPRKALLHIHEIPDGFALRILRAMVMWSRADIIFNSLATSRAFALPSRAAAQVIYNGVSGPDTIESSAYDGKRPLRIAMLGRISRIKGQEVLIDAVKGLSDDLRARLQVRMIGSAFEDSGQQAALAARIADADLSKVIGLEPFTTGTADIYRWADLVVVPSRLPESLGRVAIEAMSFGRMVIASDIGGLSEVVEDGRTGWLVPPGDVEALKASVARAIERQGEWLHLGAAGRQRYEDVFSETVVAKTFANAVIAKMQGHFPLGSRPAEARTNVEVVEC